MKRIVVRLTERGWMSKFPGDQEIIDLFGSDELPTAFTCRANWSEVREELARLNPGYQVELHCT